MTSRSVRAGREPLSPPAEPGALDPPITEPEGNSLAWASPRLTTLAADLGCSLVIEPHSDGRGGCFVPDLKPISLNDANSINHQIKTFVHELSHSLLHQNDHDEVRLTYFQEELVVESIAPTVVGGLGLDTSCYSIPYIASWSQNEDTLDIVETCAGIIDRLAKRIEDAIGTRSRLTHSRRAPLRLALQARLRAARRDQGSLVLPAFCLASRRCSRRSSNGLSRPVPSTSAIANASTPTTMSSAG